MSELMKIDIAKIDPDPSGIQPRDMLDGDTVKRYAELLDDGVTFPAIRLWDIEEKPGGKFRISDGYHRFAAHRAAGREVIVATVQVGSMIECVADAISMNSGHGKVLTDHEKYSAMLSYLALVAQAQKPMPSITYLRQMAGVTAAVAKRVLREFKASPSAEPDPELRSPADQISREVLAQGHVSPDENPRPILVPDSEPEQAVEAIHSSACVAVEKIVHDGKVQAANLRNALTAATKAYKACESVEGGVYFRQHREVFDKYIEALRKLEHGCRPEEVCACDGQGCNQCGMYGWINGNQASAKA